MFNKGINYLIEKNIKEKNFFLIIYIILFKSIKIFQKLFNI